MVHEQLFDGIHCTLSIQTFPSRIVVLKISGTDIGEFGDRPMTELAKSLVDNDPIRLFIDARDVRGASIEVSGEWAGWLQANKAHLREVNMLTGSRFVEVTAGFVLRFAALQGIRRIYTEAAAFDAALAEALT
jgi:hypothetical protein